MKIIVAQCAASGAIYTHHILSLLIENPSVEHVALIRSHWAGEVSTHEGVTLPHHPKIVEYDSRDMFAPPASGSARYDAMIIAPASVGTVGRIASGVSDSLITRTADVMLKERRKLLLLVRESPLSLIHLRQMTLLTEAGAIIMPACPSFYHGEQTIEQLCRNMAQRALTTLGVECSAKEWCGKKA